MNSHADLIRRYGKNSTLSGKREMVHAVLSSVPGRNASLEPTISSLIPQVDTIHVYMEEDGPLPEISFPGKLFFTRHEDFPGLGTCGKYYWTDDMEGYFLACADSFIYPADYASTMIRKIEAAGRKALISAGAGRLSSSPGRFSDMADFIAEDEDHATDEVVPLVSDLAVSWHSDGLRVSRHIFYQPWLSDLWMSALAREQGVQMICIAHPEGWIHRSTQSSYALSSNPEHDLQRTFLIKSLLSPERNPTSFGFNTFFDKAYVMNLDRRPDRWQKMEKIAQKYGLHLQRFPAVDGYSEPYRSHWERYFSGPGTVLPEGVAPLEDFTDKFMKYFHPAARIHFLESKLGRKSVQSPGAWGYALTYISILREAIARGYQRIIIFDDDIVVHRNFNHEFESHAKHLPPDWKIMMLGAMQHRWEPWITPEGELFYHCNGCSVASHAVAIHAPAMLPLLFQAEKLDLPIDEGAIFHIQNVYKKQSFICLPNLAIQELSDSDISSSAMKQEDKEKWIKLFRWDLENYDFDIFAPTL